MSFAHFARRLSSDAVEFDQFDHTFWGFINDDFNEIVRDSARILTQLAWAPWKSRLSLRRSIKKLSARVLQIQDTKFKRKLSETQLQLT